MRSKILQACAIAMIAASSLSYANEFDGTYVEPGTNIGFTIKKISDDQYSVTNSEWTGVAYYDKDTKTFKGLYRYNDNIKINNKDTNNAAGFHVYKINPDGSITVNVISVSDANNFHTYTINKVK